MKSGTVVTGECQKQPGDVENVQKERSRTPATVAEPDSTMSNDAGDQVIAADVEISASVERSGPETAGHNDVVTGSCSRRSFSDRFRWERASGFDAGNGERRSEVVLTRSDEYRSETGAPSYVRPSVLGLRNFAAELSSETGWIDHLPRKRQSAEAEVAPAPSLDQHPPELPKKKRRPDPLVLAPTSVEHYGYPSWLRSPRVWNGSGPIPYTPPPMLSPARRAPGLFWAAARVQNQPLWSSFRPSLAFSCEYAYTCISLY